ncbi:MAG: helix-turn-helix transcriptional regulator [Syntrophaceae bacterium]|jgi:DNA-binding transcriptional regulator YiaG|nr:helix-turn-helix transcriptional regulator [Syntrophaceae bacterium]
MSLLSMQEGIIFVDIDIPMVYVRIMTRKELKKWRAEHGYSQAKLARALSVAVMTVSRWETGLRAIPSFLHLALRCLELEGGETCKGKTTKERRVST